MALTSRVTVAAAGLLTGLAVLACVVLWNRLRRPRPAQLVGRVGLVVVCQLLAVAVTGLAINAQYGFYASWSELLGRSALTNAASAPAPARFDRAHPAAFRSAFHAGHGTVVPIVIPGKASGVPPQRALVYLPAAYGDPASPAARFPVVELLDGFPGRPESWTGPLGLQRILDAQIASRHAVPMIAVMPVQNIASPRDTQCVNVVGGPNVDTFLTQDVHRAVVSAFRAAPQRSAWALMGYSTGGYCAVNLAMRHPGVFGSAVSLSGYARPAHDRSTGDLFGHNAALGRTNTPVWRARHLRPPDLSVLTLTSRGDSASYRDAVQFAAAARPPLHVSTVVFAHGGHNFRFWQAVEPYGFSWLSEHLLAPLTPTLPPTAGRTAPALLVQGVRHG